MVDSKQYQGQLILIDGHSLLHRAFHAFPFLTSPKGEPIGAVYGFSLMLLRVINDLKPKYIAVAWDTKAPTFRQQLFSEYKGNRKETPDELNQQIDKTRSVVEALDIPQYAIEGYEADDLIGTLTSQANQDPKLTVIIVTGDMDMLQLVNEQTRVFAPRKKFSDPLLYGAVEVKERLGGLGPEQVVEYKALRGDPSDNIPGIKGIGEKTAIELLNRYKNLETIYRHIDELSKKQQGLLTEEQEVAFLSRKLAQIVRDAPVSLDIELLDFASFQPAKLKSIFHEFGFRSLMNKIPDNGKVIEKPVLPKKELTPKGKFDKVDPDQFDIRIAAHLLSGESGKQLDLSALAFRYLGQEIGDGMFAQSEEDYATYLLKEQLEKDLDQSENEQIRTLFYELEMPLKPVLHQMEKEGILVDQALMEKMTDDFGARIVQLEQDAYKEIGHEINLNSPKQLEAVLFDELRLPVLKKTKTQRSTDEEVLQQLKDLHPVISVILKYREFTKLKSTYLDPLPEFLKNDGRVHTTFNQTNVASGRLSSENPNMQNIPTDPEVGMRRLFIAGPGKKLISADYSQFELRIMAHITDDENLLAAFSSGDDIHSATAARLFEKPARDVTSQERKVAKTINFALMYGMGPHGLSQSLNIPVPQAAEYIEKFLGKYPKVALWKESHLQSVKEKGYVETMYGRRRLMPLLQSSNFHQRAAAERIAINHPLQGTQADLIKMAMIRLDREIHRQGLIEDLKMLLQVHDELVFEVAEDKADSVIGLIRAEMEGSIELKVPVEVHIGVGDNWMEAK